MRRKAPTPSATTSTAPSAVRALRKAALNPAFRRSYTPRDTGRRVSGKGTAGGWLRVRTGGSETTGDIRAPFGGGAPVRETSVPPGCRSSLPDPGAIAVAAVNVLHHCGEPVAPVHRLAPKKRGGNLR